MERAREARRTIAGAASRAPMLFQRFPHRPPILRGRLHDDFLDVLRDQPVGQAAQIGRGRPDLLALEVRVAVDLDVGHHNGQHLLVDVDSRDPVRHAALLEGAESVPRRISQGRELSMRSPTAPRRSIIRSITHAPDQTVARPHWLHWLVRSRRSRRDYSVPTPISLRFGGQRAYSNSCGNRPVRRAIQAPSLMPAAILKTAVSDRGTLGGLTQFAVSRA
jgi:hypothetical protein